MTEGTRHHNGARAFLHTPSPSCPTFFIGHPSSPWKRPDGFRIHDVRNDGRLALPRRHARHFSSGIHLHLGNARMDSAYKMCGMTEGAGQGHGQECPCSFKTQGRVARHIACRHARERGHPGFHEQPVFVKPVRFPDILDASASWGLGDSACLRR